MPRLKNKLIVMGDRLLVRPEDGEERTNAGLYLPATAVSARQAQGGWVVSVSPGTPVASPADLDDAFGESETALYVPMQAQEGNTCYSCTRPSSRSPSRISLHFNPTSRTAS